MKANHDFHKTPNILNSTVSFILLAGMLVFLLVLPFHLVIKQIFPGPIGTYWKEILLGLLVILWLVVTLINRHSVLMRSRLEGAVLIYAGLVLVRFILDRSGLTGWWGLYITIMYLPLFWLIPSVLSSHPDWLIKLLTLLTYVGAIIALGGLIEFIVNKPLWPSGEIADRQGFSDVYVYGTHLRRVYFVLDSPTILANVLAVLLPLAIALLLIQQSPRWMKITVGLSAILMMACIVLTFSRGIWVASAIGLGFMAFQGRPDKRRNALIALGILLIGLLVWMGIVIIRRGGHTTAISNNVIELPSQSFQTLPITTLYNKLIETDPVVGKISKQVWSIYDPIEQRDDVRNVVYETPTSDQKTELIYQVTTPEDGAMRFAIALSPEVWSPEKGDGVSFQIFVTPVDHPEKGQLAFVRYINPKINPNDRRWRNFLVDLSQWAGSTVNLSLITEAGPAGDWAYDWAGWADLEIVGIQQDYFLGAETENAVLDYTFSILNWSSDETNRDRLAAWRRSLSAWETSPLWGIGLGSTGVAAMRISPETAFVTESQALKMLTELGIPGIIALVYLWLQIGAMGYKTFQSNIDHNRRILLAGILASLLVIFIDGLVYQNLEVKQVNAYFWMLAGMLVFLSQEKYE